MKFIITIATLLLALSATAESNLEQLIKEAKDCAEQHSISVLACTNLMKIIHLKNPPSTLKVILYNGIGNCEENQVLQTLVLSLNDDSAMSHNKCAAAAEKINTNVWSMSVNGQCIKVSPTQDKQAITDLCMSALSL